MITHEIENRADDDPWDHVQACLNTLTNRVEIRVYSPSGEPEAEPIFCIAGSLVTVRRLLEGMTAHVTAIGNSSAKKSTDPTPQIEPKP